MYEKSLTLVLTFVGILLVGTGITGFYSIDFEQPICQTDDDCSYSVCCAVYNEEFGLCDQQENCDGIYIATKNAEEVQKTSSTNVFRTADLSGLEEEATQSYIAVALGIILLLIIAVVSYVEWQQHHETKRVVKKKVTKKRKKVKKRKKKAKK